MKIKRRTVELVKKWTIRIGVTVVFVGIIFGYTRTSFFLITSYDIRGVDESSRLLIDARLRELEKKTSYRIFQNNRILTYSKNSIIAAARDIATDAKTITVSASGLHTVRVTITLLAPSIRTDDGRAITENGIVFSTKKDVYVYPTLDIASSTLTKVTIDGLVFDKLSSSDFLIHETFIHSLLEFSSKVSSIIFPVTKISISKEGDVSLLDERGQSKVLFLRDGDTKKIWSTLVSAIDTDPLKTKLENNKTGLQYLDVRFGNKVFYRFNDGTFQNASSTAILEDHETVPQEATSLPR